MTEVGLYVHWPFCQAKCPYCDFNSHVVAQVDHDAWRRAYAAELARYKALVPDARIVSIFFGGGTPSLMEPATVAQIIDDTQRLWPIANDIEITLEANPTSVEADRFRAYRTAGVNRVSMGIQALNDSDLKRLGRLHSVTEARAAFDTARATFERISFDLIYARQDQTQDQWRAELAEALTFAADHLSLYQLAIEDGTAFGDRFNRGGLRGLPDEDRAADLYEITQEMTEAAGLPAYEVSNHATPGSESRHNMIYWTGGDYIGIGPGAHGRLTTETGRLATEAVSAPMRWLSNVLNGRSPDEITPLSVQDIAQERLMMGLRVHDGVDVTRIDVNPIKINELEGYGLIETDSTTLRLTRAGRPLLNAILRELYD